MVVKIGPIVIQINIENDNKGNKLAILFKTFPPLTFLLKYLYKYHKQKTK